MSTEERMCQDVLAKYESRDTMNPSQKEELLYNMAFVINILKDSIKQDSKQSEDIFYTKDDIMQLYGCAERKALNILKMATASGYGTQIGRKYLITPKALDEFMKSSRGKSIKF